MVAEFAELNQKSSMLQETNQEEGKGFYIRSGKLHAYIAQNDQDVRGAQKLRYDVFFKEVGAKETETLEKGLDINSFDAYADHLVVKDMETGFVVGTYRLLRQESARKHGSFYTSGEFDITCLTNLSGEILEVSRSCVDIAYRTQSVMRLLWRGLAAYIMHYKITHLFGCGSFHGVDLDALAHPLSYLYYNHLLPKECCPRVIEGHHRSMDILPKDKIDPKKALAQMPALLRRYIVIGGGVGDGVFVDHAFNTSDVCVVVDSRVMVPKFAQHYFNEPSLKKDATSSEDTSV